MRDGLAVALERALEARVRGVALVAAAGRAGPDEPTEPRKPAVSPMVFSFKLSQLPSTP